MLEKQRDKQMQNFEEKKKLMEKGITSFMPITDKFATKTDFKEDKLKMATFGLVTHEEFIAKQESLEVGEDILPAIAPVEQY